MPSSSSDTLTLAETESTSVRPFHDKWVIDILGTWTRPNNGSSFAPVNLYTDVRPSLYRRLILWLVFGARCRPNK